MPTTGLSGDRKSYVRVENNIYETVTGLYLARLRSHGHESTVYCETLEEARNALAGMVTATRNRRATEGWFDVVKEDGNEWIDTPPQASTAILTKPRQAREARERAFMLQERFKKAVHRLPPDCVAEAKAGASLSALQYGTGQVLVKRALRGLDDLPAFLIVPTEPHPDHKAAVESLGVKVVVP